MNKHSLLNHVCLITRKKTASIVTALASILLCTLTACETDEQHIIKGSIVPYFGFAAIVENQAYSTTDESLIFRFTEVEILLSEIALDGSSGRHLFHPPQYTISLAGDAEAFIMNLEAYSYNLEYIKAWIGDSAANHGIDYLISIEGEVLQKELVVPFLIEIPNNQDYFKSIQGFAGVGLTAGESQAQQLEFGLDLEILLRGVDIINNPEIGEGEAAMQIMNNLENDNVLTFKRMNPF